MTVSLRHRRLVAALILFFLWGSLSITVSAQHDIEVALDYHPGKSLNGIVVVDNLTGDYILNDSSGLTNLSAGKLYKIGYKIRNKVDVWESISRCLRIINSTGCSIQGNCHCWGCISANTSKASETFYPEIWDTSNLPLGLYNLSVEAVIINTSTGENITDDDTSDNRRVRQVNLRDDQPPYWVENLSNHTLEKNQPFIYDVNASDSFFVDRYWINDSLFFEINSSTGLITNKTGLSFGAYHLNISVNDSSGNTLSTKIRIEVTDLTPPELGIHQPGNQTYNQKIPMNLTATDTLSHLSTIWYTLDSLAEKHILWNNSNASTINHSSNITNVSGGKHTLKVYVNDSYGNTESREIELRVNSSVNASRFIQKLSGVEHIKSASLLDAGNNSINYSGNESLPVNNTFTLLLYLESDITVKIPSFSGLDLNWNQAPLLEIYTLSELGNRIGELEDLLGVEFKTLLYFNNTEKLLADQDYIDGAVIQLDWNLSNGMQVVYLQDEGEPIILGECDTGGIMCYQNTSNNLTIWLPHLSGVALWNDTRPPEIEITMPGNNTVLDDSIPPDKVFMFKVKETNPKPEDFCRYIIESGGGVVTEGSFDASESFLDKTYTFSVEDLFNGSYNFTVNCSDLYGQSTTVKHSFIVNDTTPPTIKYFDVDVDYSSGRTSARLDLSAETNEKSSCRYDTTDKSYNNMKYELDADDSGTIHTQRHTKKYTRDTSGEFYVRCRDLNGNDAVDYDGFTVNIREEDDDEDDDNDGGGGTSGVTSTANPGKGSCFDLIENCHHGACEDGIDCGGPCMPCPSCSDRRQNQGETGIDCGGPCLPCETTTSSTTTTTTSSTTTTSTSSTTTSTRKMIYLREKKEEAPAVTGMVAGFDLFSIIISFVVLAFLLLMAAVSVYAYRNASEGDKPAKKRPYELKSTRRGTRLGDV